MERPDDSKSYYQTVEQSDLDVINRNINYETRVCRILLKFYGFWIYDEQPTWLHVLSNVQVGTALIFFLFTGHWPLMTAFAKVWGDITLTSDNLVMNISLLTTEVKLVTLWIKKKDIALLFKQIVRNWHEIKTEDEQSVMLQYAKMSRFIVSCALLLTAFSVAIFHGAVCLGIVIRTENNVTDEFGYPLAVQSVYFYDITVGNRYVLTRINQLSYCIFGGILYLSTDILYCVCILHICAQLENFSHHVRNLTNIDKSLQAIQADIKKLVIKHYDIIRFTEIMESVFSFVILAWVFLFAVLFTVLSFGLISGLMGDIKLSMIQMSFYVNCTSCAIFITFVLSWLGQNLIDQSDNLNIALYDSDWHLHTNRKMLQLLMIFIKTQKPMVLTIGKFAPLTLGTFLQLMKTCAGYVSFLIAIKD